MSFSANLAKKYIFARKRHSALTVLSIAAAVALITVLFTIYSTYFSSRLDFERSSNPWHAYLIGLTREEAEAFVASEDFADHRFEDHEYTIDSEKYYDSELELRFKEDVEDCDKAMENAANAAGFSFDENDPGYIGISYYLNDVLLQLENIGVDAKAANIQMFALFYVLILFVIFCSRLVIDTAFEISSKEREKQFGVLQSIGASKKQIAAVMTYEGGFLSLIGIPLGLILGIGASYLLYLAVSASEGFKILIEDGFIGELRFSVSPLFILVVIVTGLVWVLFSAEGTGMRAAKMSPVEAIRSRGTAVKKVKRHSLFGLIFGWTGRLASRNIRRGKKRFIITVLSVMLSMGLVIAFGYLIDMLVVSTENEYAFYEYDFFIEEYTRLDMDGSELPRKLSYRDINNLLNESGYFDNVVCTPELPLGGNINDIPVSDELREFLESCNTDFVYMDVRFVDEALYKKMFGNDPDIPYSQLAEENGYVLLNSIQISNDFLGFDTEKSFNAFDISKGDTITTENRYYIPYDEPIVTAAEDEFGEITGTTTICEETVVEDLELKILDIPEERNDIIESWAHVIRLIGTYDQFDEQFIQQQVIQYRLLSENDVTRNMVISADLKEGADYEKAMEFLDRHNLHTWSDAYHERLAAQNKVAMAKMIGYTLLALITLIAVINLVNVISTGILNRRPEIASMKSLGMSQRQLVKMICIECAQYAVVSGIASIILSDLLLYMTVVNMNLFKLSVDEMGGFINYGKPILYALVAMAAAFLCALAAAAFPLRQIEKSSITEEIKRID